MVNENIYLDAYGSVVKYIQDILDEIVANGFSDNIEFRDLDGHAEDAVIPNTDFIFLKDFSGDLENHLRYWVFNIGVSTFEDEGMFRHRQIMNHIIKRAMPLTNIQLYDAESSKPKKGTLVVDGNLTLQPFSKYNTRAVQYLLVNVASTATTHGPQHLDHI